MPFCPQCNVEYKEDILTCSDCQEDLLPGVIPAEVLVSGEWYTIESVPNEVAGHILKSVLEDNDIDVYLRCHDLPAHGGVKGNIGKSEWGDILVPGYAVHIARECIKSYFESLQEG